MPDAAAPVDATPSDQAIDALVEHDASTLGPVRISDVIVYTAGDASAAVDGVRGVGMGGGGTDVYSLDYRSANDHLVLAWSNATLTNGPGDDLAVFENAFAEAGGGTFMDQIVVEVSRDNINWRAIDHAYTSPNQNVYLSQAMYRHGFAGITPVLLNDDTNPVDPFDRAAAGGDGFDLDNVSGSDAEAVAIRANGISYVRLVSAPSRTNPTTGSAYLHDSLSNGPDVDGVYGRYLAAR